MQVLNGEKIPATAFLEGHEGKIIAEHSAHPLIQTDFFIFVRITVIHHVIHELFEQAAVSNGQAVPFQQRGILLSINAEGIHQASLFAHIIRKHLFDLLGNKHRRPFPPVFQSCFNLVEKGGKLEFNLLLRGFQRLGNGQQSFGLFFPGFLFTRLLEVVTHLLFNNETNNGDQR